MARTDKQGRRPTTYVGDGDEHPCRNGVQVPRERLAGRPRRTLQHRLSTAGVSHEVLVAQIRLAAAAAVPERTNAKTLNLALDLGYSDYANFTRAFRRWAGCSPQEYRARHGRRQGR